MQSVVRKASYSSVRIAWLDREQLVNNVRSLARALADARPEVKKVILFGSAAKGTSTPASDVDLVLVVESTSDRFIDRPFVYLPYFSDVGLGVDLAVYTADEVRTGDISLLRVAESTGQVVFERS